MVKNIDNAILGLNMTNYLNKQKTIGKFA